MSAVKIGPLIIMVTALVAVVALFAAIGAAAGMLIAFLLAAETCPPRRPLGRWPEASLALCSCLTLKRTEGKGCRKKPAEKTARLEGYKASVAPFCGLFSLHKKIAQNGRLSLEAASGTAGRT